MTEANEIASDLKFIKQVVERRRRSGGMVIWIAVMWAVIVMVGCLLNDFRPNASGRYWNVASLAGFVVSCVLGYRHARRMGENDGREGVKQMMHWGSIFLAGGALAAILSRKAHVDGVMVGQMMLIIVGMAHFLAGVHMNRRFLVTGAALMLAAVAVGFVPAYPWTVAGAIISSSMVLSFVPGGRRHG